MPDPKIYCGKENFGQINLLGLKKLSNRIFGQKIVDPKKLDSEAN